MLGRDLVEQNGMTKTASLGDPILKLVLYVMVFLYKYYFLLYIDKLTKVCKTIIKYVYLNK